MPTPAARPPAVTRRGFAAAAAALLVSRPGPAQPKDDRPPVTGPDAPGLAAFDRLMSAFVRDNGVPGAALAVARGGKLVYARGFGYADVEKRTPVRPASLFRVASVSKPVTAVAVLRLVEKKAFKLDDKVVDLMGLKAVVGRGDKPDDRWKRVTVRHCLRHTGGWDSKKSYDPVTRPWEIAKAVGKGPPVPAADVVRYMMGQPLDFDPGERAAYSNLGYLVLGRVVAAAAGTTYEEFVRREVFGRVGVTGPQLGRALPEKRAKGEVRYYDSKKRLTPCVYPPRQDQKVPFPDGGENFEAFEAFGGWVASAVDVVRFAAAFDDPARCPLLRAGTVADMWARPAGAAGDGPDGRPSDTYMGCGWLVRPVGDAGKLTAWHTGYLAGTEALLVRRWDGLNWAVLFNTNDGAGGKALSELIDVPLHDAADGVTEWPDGDLFPSLLKAPGG